VVTDFPPKRRTWAWGRHLIQLGMFTHYNQAKAYRPFLDRLHVGINAVRTCATKEILILCRNQGKVVPRARLLIGEPGSTSAKTNTAPALPEQNSMKRQSVSLCSSGNHKRVRMSEWRCGRRRENSHLHRYSFRGAGQYCRTIVKVPGTPENSHERILTREF
jgi:hypothetical protein